MLSGRNGKGQPFLTNALSQNGSLIHCDISYELSSPIVTYYWETEDGLYGRTEFFFQNRFYNELLCSNLRKQGFEQQRER